MTLSSCSFCPLSPFIELEINLTGNFLILSPPQLAKLTAEDMKVINNMKILEGAADKKKTSDANFSLKFDGQKVYISIRRKKLSFNVI